MILSAELKLKEPEQIRIAVRAVLCLVMGVYDIKLYRNEISVLPPSAQKTLDPNTVLQSEYLTCRFWRGCVYRLLGNSVMACRYVAEADLPLLESLHPYDRQFIVARALRIGIPPPLSVAFFRRVLARLDNYMLNSAKYKLTFVTKYDRSVDDVDYVGNMQCEALQTLYRYNYLAPAIERETHCVENAAEIKLRIQPIIGVLQVTLGRKQILFSTVHRATHDYLVFPKPVTGVVKVVYTQHSHLFNRVRVSVNNYIYGCQYAASRAKRRRVVQTDDGYAAKVISLDPELGTDEGAWDETVEDRNLLSQVLGCVSGKELSYVRIVAGEHDAGFEKYLKVVERAPESITAATLARHAKKFLGMTVNDIRILRAKSVELSPKHKAHNNEIREYIMAYLELDNPIELALMTRDDRSALRAEVQTELVKVLDSPTKDDTWLVGYLFDDLVSKSCELLTIHINQEGFTL